MSFDNYMTRFLKSEIDGGCYRGKVLAKNMWEDSSDAYQRLIVEINEENIPFIPFNIKTDKSREHVPTSITSINVGDMVEISGRNLSDCVLYTAREPPAFEPIIDSQRLSRVE